MTKRMKRRVKTACVRILGFVIFIVAIAAWMYLYFGMPFSGILDVVLQIATWFIAIVGIAMTIAVYPYPCKRRKRH